jgi:hypothetical protein
MKKLDIGRILQGVFDNLGALMPVLLTGAVLVYLPLSIAEALLTEDMDLSAALLSLVGFLFFAFGVFWYEGVVVLAVQASRAGQKPSPGPIFSAALPFALPLLGATILAVLGILIGLVLLIIPGLFLLTKWFLIVPAIVLEKRRVMESFNRSWELVKGVSWEVFAVLVIVSVLSMIISSIIEAVIGDDGVLYVALGTFLGGIVTAPFTGLAAAGIYFDLKEQETPAAF